MNLILPVAGAGLRCRPWSATRPKPLLPIANEPMLGHALDAILPLRPERIVLITGWLGEQIEAWARATYPEQEVAVVRQDALLGQSHAVLQARAHLAGEGMILFPDMLFRLGPDSLAGLPDADGAIFTAEVTTAQRPNFAIARTGPEGWVTDIVEKPREPIAGDAVVGMYWLRDLSRLGAAIEDQIARGLAAPNGEFALADAIGLMIGDGARIASRRLDDWIGAGSNASLLGANRWVLDRMPIPADLAASATDPRRYPGSIVIPPSAIDPTAVIERSVIGPYASIGAGAQISGSVVRDSIVDVGASIRHAMIEGSLIGPRARITGAAPTLNIGDDGMAR